MKTKIQKSDYIFLCVIAAFSLLHILCLFTLLPYNDELLYSTTPLRFINGDIMMQHEWHLTQFSSIFLYPLVLFWIKIVGSTEGIILFLRCVYLIVHMLISVFIYKSFRNYGGWAIIASLLFYTQVAYRMFTVSYMTLNVIFILLLGLFLFLAYQRRATRYYIFAGICYASACICNPLYCVLYILYILVCILWALQLKRGIISHVAKSKKKKQKIVLYISEKSNTYKWQNIFLCKKTVALFSCGIFFVALICIVYFFISGGTLSFLFNGIKNMLMSTEYGNSFPQKIKYAWNLYDSISLQLPFLLPLHYLMVFLDEDCSKPKHRIAHLLVSAAISIIFALGVAKVFFTGEENAFALSLPFIIFSFTCYILTRNKDHILFYCIWCMGTIGAIIQFFASNTLLTSFFAVMVILHIPGIFFIRKLFIEIREEKKRKHKLVEENKKLYAFFCIVVVIVCFTQIFVNSYLYAYGRIPKYEGYQKATYGPLSQLCLEDEYYNSYVKSLNDLDIIKSRSEESDPVLISSLMGWMHLYIERPCAAYSTALLSINQDLLRAFYKQNPDRIPKYIYVSFAESNYNISDRKSALNNVEIFESMFDCTVEELTMGFLLTVNELKK